MSTILSYRRLYQSLFELMELRTHKKFDRFKSVKYEYKDKEFYLLCHDCDIDMADDNTVSSAIIIIDNDENFCFYESSYITAKEIVIPIKDVKNLLEDLKDADDTLFALSFPENLKGPAEFKANNMILSVDEIVFILENLKHEYIQEVFL